MVLAIFLLVLVVAYWAVLEYLRHQRQSPLRQSPLGQSPLRQLPLEQPTLQTQPLVAGTESHVQLPPLFISLLVVVRNEAQNLPRLFEALCRQELSPGQFELHLIDDASTDASLALSQAFAATAPFAMQVHQLQRYPQGGSPKKAAISQVLPQAKGGVIVITDGDCQPAEGWLRTLQQFWQQHQPVFVSGPVRYVREKGVFGQLQSLDFAALIGVGGGMLNAGMPGMCNAANMAYSKEAFDAVGGYAGNEGVPSGDDEFLLQKLAGRFPEKVCFLNARAAVVSTEPCASWQLFVAQRKRWAGKWRLHQGIKAKLPALAILLFYLLLSVSLLLPLWVPAALPLVALAWGLKGVADFRFLHSVMKLLGKPLPPGVFLLLELVYPLYVLFFAVAANRGGFIWKDRSYNYATIAHDRTRISGTG